MPQSQGKIGVSRNKRIKEHTMLEGLGFTYQKEKTRQISFPLGGDAYYTYETDLQSAFRLYSDPNSRQRYTGFRCVMDFES